MSSINLRIDPISNGYLVSGSKLVEGYEVAELPTTYVAEIEQVIDGLPSLFAAVNALTSADCREDF